MKQSNNQKLASEVIKFLDNAFKQLDADILKALKFEAMTQYNQGKLSASEHCDVEAWLDHYLYEV